MNILFTVQHYYPFMSGVPVVVRYLAEGLQNKGHKVSIATTWLEGLSEQESLEGVDIYRFKLYESKTRGYFGDIEKFIQFVKTFNCDVIINECTQCVTTDLLLKHLCELKPYKILHSHGFSGLTLSPIKKMSTFKHTLGNTYNWLKWKRYYTWFYKYMIKYDKLLCLSYVDSGKSYMDKYAGDKVEILQNAANDIFFKNKTQHSALSKYVDFDGSDYIISVANYTAVKNQKMIMEAFYRANVNKCELVLIGSQKTSFYYMLNSLKKKLDGKYGFKRIHILTGVDRNDLPSIIEHAKVYLVSSTFEEYSISIIEAMSRAVPFISTDVGNAKILPGGIVIHTVSEMANEIERLLTNEEERIELGQLGKMYANKYCTESGAVNKLEEILVEVVNK